MESLKYLQELDKSSRQNIVAKAYNQIIKASAGLGTDVDAILAAIKLINTHLEFSQLLNLFKDKKTGYDSFQNMINGEYDSLNYNDVVNIVNKLKSIGVTATFAGGAGGGRFKTFEGNFKIIKIQSPYKLKFETELKRQLLRAQLFWIGWLTDPVTKKKVQANYANTSLGKKNVDAAFKRYNDMLKDLTLEFYDNSMNETPYTKYPVATIGDAAAFVVPWITQKIIYVNCTERDPRVFGAPDWYGTLIHEIQHIIYHILPLNPDIKLRDAFVSNNTVTATEKAIKSALDGMYNINQDGNYVLKPKSTQKQTNFTKIINLAKFNNPWISEPDIMYWLTNLPRARKSVGVNYICSETELGSCIARMKELFNVKPDAPVFPAKMIIPYIKLNAATGLPQKHNGHVNWFLLCWVQKGFPVLQPMLDRINQLAVNKTKTSGSTSPEGQA